MKFKKGDVFINVDHINLFWYTGPLINIIRKTFRNDKYRFDVECITEPDSSGKFDFERTEMVLLSRSKLIRKLYGI